MNDESAERQHEISSIIDNGSSDLLNDSRASNFTDDESDQDASIDESESGRSVFCKYQQRNESQIRCFTARDIAVSSCMLVAVGTDKGTHIFIPRYLCLHSVRNAIYRQILLPGPSVCLREQLFNLNTYSYHLVAAFSNQCVVRKVSWAPFGLLVASLTNDGQLIVHKVDLTRSSSENFASVNLSVGLLAQLTTVPQQRQTMANVDTLREKAEFGEVSHFSWVEMSLEQFKCKQSLDLILINKKLQLFGVCLGLEMNVKTKVCATLNHSPSVVTASMKGDGNKQVVIGFTNGAVLLMILNSDMQVESQTDVNSSDDMMDFVAVQCGTISPNCEFACLAKYNRLIFIGLEDSALGVRVEIEVPEEYNIHRLKFSNNKLLYVTKTGVVGVCVVDSELFQLKNENALNEALFNSLHREAICLESKYEKFLLGAKPAQNLNGIDASKNLEFIFYVYEDGYIAKREKRDFKLVCISTNASTYRLGDTKTELNCFYSDVLFNEHWFINSYYMDSKLFVEKYWGNKARMLSVRSGAKFSSETITDSCPLCCNHIVNLTQDLIGLCSDGCDWPICYQGHIIKSQKDLITCLLCRMTYCSIHKPFSCLFCEMPIY